MGKFHKNPFMDALLYRIDRTLSGASVPFKSEGTIIPIDRRVEMLAERLKAAEEAIKRRMKHAQAERDAYDIGTFGWSEWNEKYVDLRNLLQEIGGD